MIASIAGITAVAIAGVLAFTLLGKKDDTSTDAGPGASTSQSSVGGTATQTSSDASAATSDSSAQEPTSTSQAPTAPTTMPDLSGKTSGEVRALLPGVTVTEKQSLVEDGAAGTVIGQSVKAGDPTGTAVTITVAEQAVIQYVDELTAVSGGFSKDAATIKGKSYPHAVNQSICGWDSGQTASYNLGTYYRQLKATVGQDDSSTSSTNTALVEVFGDGKKLWSKTIAFGQTYDLDIDVTKVLRLEIKVNKSECSGDESSSVVLGNPRLLGLSSEVPSPTSTE
ncbi:NPCBM/NEW2 domain-containing protein [Yimella sp. cx-573]|nr:NPCBM/NEW2 domain-containing protein [Yimella sp. cx-573]